MSVHKKTKRSKGGANGTSAKEQENTGHLSASSSDRDLKSAIWDSDLGSLKVPYSTFTSASKPLALIVGVMGSEYVGKSELINQYGAKKLEKKR